MKRTKKAKAFTLIELLVVISIIALLLSILMPALSKVKEQARRMVCSSNMRQLGIGIVTYATEYDGWGPPTQCDGYENYPNYPFALWWEVGNPNLGGYGYWYHFLMAGNYIPRPEDGVTVYMGDNHVNPASDNPPIENSILSCPSLRDVNHQELFAYGMNVHVGGLTPGNKAYDGDPKYGRYRKLSSVNSSGRMIYIGHTRKEFIGDENAWPSATINIFTHKYPKIGNPWVSRGNNIGDYHNGGTPLAYVDGHVEYKDFLDDLLWLPETLRLNGN